MEPFAPHPRAEAAARPPLHSDEPLSRALARCAAERTTGVLQVAGEPGGLVHIAAGLVVSVDTPGSPGVEAQLLRSGRLTEAGWTAAVGALAASGPAGAALAAVAGAAPGGPAAEPGDAPGGAPAGSAGGGSAGGGSAGAGPAAGGRSRDVPAGAGPLAAELIGRGLVPAAELERLTLAAAFDGAFAIATGQVVGCQLAAPEPVWLPAVPGLPVDRLWQEIERRRRVLAMRREPVAHDRDRIVPVSWLGRDTVALSPEQWDILNHADGRRTARDIAFVLGRGVYAVTLEIARLFDAGLVQVASRREVPRLPPAAGAGPDGWPRPGEQPAGAPAGPADPAGVPGAPGGGGHPAHSGAPESRLPRRRPGVNGAPGAGGVGLAGRWSARLPHGWVPWSSTD